MLKEQIPLIFFLFRLQFGIFSSQISWQYTVRLGLSLGLSPYTLCQQTSYYPTAIRTPLKKKNWLLPRASFFCFLKIYFFLCQACYFIKPTKRSSFLKHLCATMLPTHHCWQDWDKERMVTIRLSVTNGPFGVLGRAWAVKPLWLLWGLGHCLSVLG